MYGSVWLFNHVTTQYLIERERQAASSSSEAKTTGAALPMIPLDYNPDNDVVTMMARWGRGKDRARANLSAGAQDAGMSSPRQNWSRNGVTDSQLSRICPTAVAGKVKNSQPNGKPGLYTVVDSMLPM